MVSYGCERTYLFRGKSEYNGEWVFGSLAIIKNWDSYFIMPQESQGVMTGSIQIDPETASQYIMGDDMNGDKIFEGDIVLVYDKHGVAHDGFAVVSDRNTLISKGGGYWRPQDTVQLEVVGNIWDDFDMLDDRTQKWIDNYYRRHLYKED